MASRKMKKLGIAGGMILLGPLLGSLGATGLGVVIFIVGFIYLIIVLNTRYFYVCPHCKREIHKDATACPSCLRDV